MGLLRVRFSATKEKGMHQTKISTKTEKDGFWPAVPKSILELYIITESLVCYVCALFSIAKSMPRMGSCIRFVAVE